MRMKGIPDAYCSWAIISAIWWWASSSDTLVYPSIFAFPLLPLHCWSITMLMSLLIGYTHIPFYFCFSFTSSALSIHHYALQLHVIALAPAQQSHSLHQTNLTYLMDTWFMIHMFLLIFLVSPTCALPQSDQSWALALRGQALCFRWALCSLSCLPFIFNLPVFYLLLRSLSAKSHTIAHTSFPQNWDLALTPCTILHLSHTISHRITLPCNHTVFTLHYTWRQSLAPRSHPQSPIGFILRSLLHSWHINSLR